MMGATQQCSVLNLRDASAMRRLVIVADNSLIVQAIRIGFHKSGEFKLIGTANARTTSARTILGPAPDAILFDDMERSERALELLAEIRAEDENVPVLMLSIHLDPDWLDRLFRAGANSVISKATHPAALATLVRETLNGHIVHRPPAAARQPQARGPVIAGENLPLTPRASSMCLPARGVGVDQRLHRAAPLGDRADGQVPPQEHLPQARRGESHAGESLRSRQRPGRRGEQPGRRSRRAAAHDSSLSPERVA